MVWGGANYGGIVCLERQPNLMVTGATHQQCSAARAYCVIIILGRGPAAVVKAACLKSRRSWVRSPSPIQVPRNKNVYSPLTRNNPVLWETSIKNVLCPTSDHRGSNFESRVWRAVSSYHPQEVFLVSVTCKCTDLT